MLLNPERQIPVAWGHAKGSTQPVKVHLEVDRYVKQGYTILLIGSVSSGYRDPTRRGDVNVIAHDLATGQTRITELHDRLECDDHNVPALLALPGGRMMAVYSRHGTDGVIRMRTSGPVGIDIGKVHGVAMPQPG